jgi:hypothetical protein
MFNRSFAQQWAVAFAQWQFPIDISRPTHCGLDAAECARHIIGAQRPLGFP